MADVTRRRLPLNDMPSEVRRSVAEMAEEDIASLAEYVGSTVDGTAATSGPVEGGSSAKVRQVEVIGHAFKTSHVVLLDPRSVAHLDGDRDLVGRARRPEGGWCGRSTPASESRVRDSNPLCWRERPAADP